MRERPRSHRARRERRAGAALVEAIIVCLTTMCFFASTWFVHDLMHNKGIALRSARYQAWAATRFNCESASVTGQASQDVRVPTPLLSEPGTPGTRTVRARTVMACNVEPRADDTIVSAVLSMLDLSSIFN